MNDFKILDFNKLRMLLEDLCFKQLHIHHTWKPAHSSFKGKNHIALQEAMKRFHVEVNGWDDIGQHLSLMPDGKWVTGRSLKKDPASIVGWNKDSLAVEMVGNFDLPGTGFYNSLGYDRLEGEQRKQMLNLIYYFGERFGYERIVFHREKPGVKKTCPGTSLNKNLLIEEAKNANKMNNDVSSWAAEAMKWGIENKLISLINPKEEINLERLMTVLYRFNNLGKSKLQ